MKYAYLSFILLVILLYSNYNVYAQTNTTLSNLQSPTAINQTLLPNGNKVHDLGSPALYWKDLYTDRLFLRGQLVIHTPGNQNLFFGNAGITSLAGQLNTGLGYLTLRSLTTGSYNTASGVESMFSTNTGSYNTATGYRSLYLNTTGTRNATTGYMALYNNISGRDNIAYGYQSMYSNTEGSSNTALGRTAMYSNTTGYGNTAVGSFALYSNTTGNENVAVGKQAMSVNITGSGNVAVGNEALSANYAGDFNVAVGARALVGNREGFRNSAFGASALSNNESGSLNTAIGNMTMYSNGKGSQNTANGYQALRDNNDGHYNTATGVGALLSNYDGYSNTATGYYALSSNINGLYNTAVGQHAMTTSSTGGWNSAFGYGAMVNMEDGFENTAIGTDVMHGLFHGSFNSALGAQGFMTDNINNATIIGYSTEVYQSNQVRIGNTNVTSIGGPVGWTTISDGRYKKNIQENIAGLVFINKLRPVSYTMDIEALDNFNAQHRKRMLDSLPQAARTILDEAAKEAANIVYDGFVAQEVETAAREINFAFSGVDKPKSEKGFYGLRYDHFVVPLVKAVQELSHMNDTLRLQQDSLEQQLNTLRQENNNLAARLEKLEAILNAQSNASAALNSVTLSNAPALQQTQLTNATLEQNIPNPFGNSTTIPYTLPQNYTTAQIIITDQFGKQLKQVSVSGTGKGMLNIDASTLSTGTYQYSLIVNGKLISTRQMILNK